MKNKVKILLCLALVLLIVSMSVVLGGFIRIKVLESRLQPVTQPFSEMERVPMCVNYIFDTSETEKCMGFADYAFFGTVEEILGTEYDELFYRRFVLWEEFPFTVYKVKVHRNIKGTLPEEITLYFNGGQQPNGLLEEYRTLPENKTTNVFFCSEVEGKLVGHSADYLGGYDWYIQGNGRHAAVEKYETAFKNQDLSVNAAAAD
ncbi:MAG: hypothetical protein UHM85_11560 [Acutalibacteraceae bacterium]|nr:hypothetical protein [Acutalibacteraceae bacterium]